MSWECRFGFRPRDLRLRPTSCGLGNRFQIKTSQGVSNVDIGFIGLGAMGSAVATNLVNKSGHAVTVWNRTEAKAEPLVAAGAKLAQTPKEAGAGKSIGFSMLADDFALHAALFGDDGLLAGPPQGALHLSPRTHAAPPPDHRSRRPY